MGTYKRPFKMNKKEKKRDRVATLFNIVLVVILVSICMKFYTYNVVYIILGFCTVFVLYGKEKFDNKWVEVDADCVRVYKGNKVRYEFDKKT